ncbi:hypothetical protein DAPPUDRAFT_113641 [Daphnia pulex]|uniref:Uncharacterized protein n=1 Tax=Daphnia pulex TaxID=6669 RepID=E9HFM1_DAPPU|nr:hypothetical protein DAPPUDRAFT_113641 [Daphnia pulex]|eukprot:EFX69481.1 hypothetical protein DAPPUDRAFT_113641 [Daphnia pulex]
MADPEALAAETYAKINDSFTYNDPGFCGAVTYNQEDNGTAHMSVLDGNGMAVSVWRWMDLGANRMMNDEMDDFSSPNVINYFGVPPSPANFIRPGKRPMSFMTPTIIVNSRTGRDIVNNMTTRGHSVTEFPGNGAVVCGITVEADGFIYANSDWRKSGDVQGIDPVDL